MNDKAKPFSDAIIGKTGYVKKHSTYCTMKQLMVLKSMMDDGDELSRKQFFDNILGANNLNPHLDPNDWAKGVESIFEPDIGHINQVSQKFRKRVERNIHRIDLSDAGKKVGDISEMSRPAAMRLKTVMAFSQEFPNIEVNKGLLRRMRDNNDNIMQDVMTSKDIRDDTIKGIYFGRGNFSLPSKIANIMEKNTGIQSLIKDMMTSYKKHIDDSALQSNMSHEDRESVHKKGHIALWKNLKEKMGGVVAGVGQTIKQGIAVIAISMIGAGAMEMSKQQQVELSYSPTASSEQLQIGSINQPSTTSESTEVDLAPELSVSLKGSKIDSLNEASYTVREGDTLWSISSEHLQSISGSSPSDNDIANFMDKYGYDSQHLIFPGERVTMEIDDEFFEPHDEPPSLSQ